MIGKKIKDIRTQKGLSQKVFADILGTSSGYISEIEQGKKQPGSDFLLSLKRFFGISLDWLLTGEASEEYLLVAGKRIENYRMSLRYKSGEFARLVDIPKELLSNIEKQLATPTQDVIDSIIKNTDINPAWLSTGEGPMRKGDYRTGDGRPFQAYDEQAPGQDEMDHGLMWKVLETMHFAMHDLGLDLKELSENKRDTIKDLLYSDALHKGRQPDERYARILCGLTYCEACGEAKRKERIADTGPQTLKESAKSESHINQNVSGSGHNVAGGDITIGNKRAKK